MWKPGDRLPTEIDERSIEVDLTRAVHACEPVDGETLAASLAIFLLLWKADPDWENGLADVYLIALQDLPEDLLRSALERCAKTSKWRPKPAEIRDTIADEFAARRQARSLLRFALIQLQTLKGERLS